jgi:hypothetical protein
MVRLPVSIEFELILLKMLDAEATSDVGEEAGEYVISPEVGS